MSFDIVQFQKKWHFWPPSASQVSDAGKKIKESSVNSLPQVEKLPNETSLEQFTQLALSNYQFEK